MCLAKNGGPGGQTIKQWTQHLRPRKCWVSSAHIYEPYLILSKQLNINTSEEFILEGHFRQVIYA